MRPTSLLHTSLTILLAASAFTAPVFAGTSTLGETRIPLNGFWPFRIDPLANGQARGWHSAAYNQSDWDRLEVPGSWELVNETANYVGKAWYRTNFATPTLTGGQRALLEFEAVSMGFRVFLNGKPIGERIVGNLPERFDVTSQLNDKGENVLAVEVDNSLSWGAYTNWGGIRRPVTLRILPPAFALRQEIISTPDLAKGSAAVRTKCIIRNAGDSERTVTPVCRIAFAGRQVAESTLPAVKVAPGADKAVTFAFDLPPAMTRLWHFDHPHLYTSEVTLMEGDVKRHGLIDRFGIRRIAIEGGKFTLNGEPVRLAGMNWVADDRATGNTLPAWRYKEDIDRMKSLGCNMARLSHRPLPSEVLDYLDEKGMLTISEFNIWPQFLTPDAPEPREFARALVHEQFNHPGVVGWSIGNEMGDRNKYPQVDGYVESMISHIKRELDPTRLVTYVSNTADSQSKDSAGFGDWILINKYDRHATAPDKLKTAFPGKPVFMTEYGAHGSNLIYDTPDRTVYKDLIADKLSGIENLFGFAVWTFNDYRSTFQVPNPATTTPVHQNRQWGCVDSYRNKKRCYAQIKELYAPLRALDVNVEKAGSRHSAVVTLGARAPLDIPAYILRGYRIVWEVRGADSVTRAGGILKLPDLKPGDPDWNRSFQWTSSADDSLLKVTLLSPTGYSLMERVTHFAKPAPPAITSVIKAPRSVRIVVKRDEAVPEHVLIITAKGKSRTVGPTIDHYIDVEELPVGVPHQITVAGVNGAGQGEPSKAIEFTPSKGPELLPPVVWMAEPGASSCTLGLSWLPFDQYYQVRHRPAADRSAPWSTSLTRTFGSIRIAGLTDGTPYHIQVARHPAGGPLSVWSEVLTVTPGSPANRGTARVHGILRQDGETLISCSSAKHATGYRLTVKGGPAQWINRSEMEYFDLNLPTQVTTADLSLVPASDAR